jgi:hypothetical protein
MFPLSGIVKLSRFFTEKKIQDTTPSQYTFHHFGKRGSDKTEKYTIFKRKMSLTKYVR